ncbi:MAG: glycosyltransferase, partial [Solirubrobacteraceae bacterium]
MSATRIVLFRPTLSDGGADRVTLTLLERLPRERYQPTLVLVRREGALADRVPADVRVIDLGRRRLALAVGPLARVLRAEDPDAVLCTAGGANVVATLAHRLARSRARLVLSERNAVRRPGLEWRSRFEVPLKRAIYPLADAVTAVSE